MTGPLRDIAAAAEWLSIPQSTLETWVTERRVPFTRLAGKAERYRHVRFSDDHLAEIVAMGEERPVAPLRLAKPPTNPPSNPPPQPPRPPGPSSPPAPPGPRPNTGERAA